MSTGHYTQVAWAETYLVGAGFVLFHDSSNRQWPYKKMYVINYGPAGNMQSAAMYRIGQPASQCPPGTEEDVKYPGLCAIKSAKPVAPVKVVEAAKPDEPVKVVEAASEDGTDETESSEGETEDTSDDVSEVYTVLVKKGIQLLKQKLNATTPSEHKALKKSVTIFLVEALEVLM